MKVKELIGKLSALDSDAEVVVSFSDEIVDIENVTEEVVDGIDGAAVVIETEDA